MEDILFSKKKFQSFDNVYRSGMHHAWYISCLRYNSSTLKKHSSAGERHWLNGSYNIRCMSFNLWDWNLWDRILVILCHLERGGANRSCGDSVFLHQARWYPKRQDTKCKKKSSTIILFGYIYLLYTPFWYQKDMKSASPTDHVSVFEGAISRASIWH